ncbi:MAG: aminoacyl-tRNA hydrolase [Anaerolineae bacterium]|nr:aminoacyl-tRNA hydrolase [Anaerolineae bacterium]
MLQVTPDITIDESELEEEFVRSSGPGGQKVNKVATAVQLRFNVFQSSSLPEPVRERLLRLAAGHISDQGVLTINARRFRSQQRNRQDARERLAELVRQAARPPRRRRPTRPSAASRSRRLESKRRRGELKRLRRPPASDSS